MKARAKRDSLLGNGRRPAARTSRELSTRRTTTFELRPLLGRISPSELKVVPGSVAPGAHETF